MVVVEVVVVGKVVIGDLEVVLVAESKVVVGVESTVVVDVPL